MGAVDVGSRERFEIELEEQAPKRSRFRHRDEPQVAPTRIVDPAVFSPPDGDVVFTPSAQPDPSEGASDRNRLIVTGLAVGAVALFLGWSLGRAGGGDGEAAQTGATTATTVEDPESSAATTVATGDTLPEASLPSTTRPRPTTTTTLPPVWEESQVDVDGRLDGQADRIVAVTDAGGLVELDLATNTVRRLDTSRPRGGSALAPVAGDDWIALAFDDGNPPIVYQGDATKGTPTGISDPWSLLWQPATDSVWMQQWNELGRPQGLVEYSIDGTETGRRIDTRGLWASRIDLRGGFVVGDGSIGAFSVSPDGSQRLADGYIVSMGVNHILVYACAENFDSCAFSLIDRNSGESRLVPVGEDLMIDLLSGGYWGPMSTPMINASGTATLITLPDPTGPPQVAVLDLVSGEVAWQAGSQGSFSGYGYVSGAWSADGRFAYVVRDDVLVAVDPAGESFPVVLGDALTDIRSLTLRPAS